MSLTMLRCHFVRTVANGNKVLLNGFGKQNKIPNVVTIQVATLKATHGEKYDGYPPEPYPYETKKYRWYNNFWNHAKDMIVENSRIITIEGNIGTGKNEFGQKLAKEFDLKFFPSVKNSELYVHPQNGLDFASIYNDAFDYSSKFYNLDTFVNDPDPASHGRAAMMIRRFYRLKYERYMKALQHLLNTGQGAVIVNSVYSDEAYLETYYDLGYLTDRFRKNFYIMRQKTIDELLRPHLLIFLDVPVPVVRKNLDKRNDRTEARFNDKFLQTLDENLKSRVQDRMKSYSEILEVDWSEPGDDLDMDWIAEEIATMKFEGKDPENPLFIDWHSREDDDLDWLRGISGNYAAIDRIFKTAESKLLSEIPEVGFSGDNIDKLTWLVDEGRTSLKKQFFNKMRSYFSLDPR